MFGEFDGAELGRDTDEITRTGGDLWREAVRVALVIAEVVAKEIARRREQLWEEQRRAAARKIWEDRQRAEPVLRAAMSEEFWQDPTPQDIGQAWQAAMEWAQSDPEAAAVLQHMRDQLESRYGLVPDGVQLDVADLSRALALGAPQMRTEAAEAREDAAAWRETSSLYVIRDPTDPELILHRGELRTVPGESIEAASARALKEWAAANGRDLDGTIGIETFANEAVPGNTPVTHVTGERAQAVVDAEARRQQRLVSGAEKGSLDELHYAVYAELDRNEEAARLLGEGAEGYDDLREASKRLALKAAAVEAEIRGEDSRYVYQAATLRATLGTEEWWATATPARVGHMWDQIRGWPDTRTKTQMTAFLEEQIFSNRPVYIELDNNTEGKQVASILTDAEIGYTDRAVYARGMAEELFRKAFDASAEAAQLSGDADKLAARPDGDAHAIEDMRKRALALTRDAYTFYAQGAAATGQAVHLQGVADDQVALTPEALREQFNQRWGHEPNLASAASLTVPESGGTPAAGRPSTGAPVPSAASSPASSPQQTSHSSGERDSEGVGAIGVAAIGLSRSVQRRRQRVRADAVPQPYPTRSRVHSAGTGIG